MNDLAQWIVIALLGALVVVFGISIAQLDAAVRGVRDKIRNLIETIRDASVDS